MNKSLLNHCAVLWDVWNLMQVNLVLLGLLFACSYTRYSTSHDFLRLSLVLFALFIRKVGHGAGPTNLFALGWCYLFRDFHLWAEHFLTTNELHVVFRSCIWTSPLIVSQIPRHFPVSSRHLSMQNICQVLVHGSLLVCIACSFSTTKFLLGATFKDFK